MSLSTIIQKIDTDAEASRQKLLARAKAEADRILEQARADAEQEAADLLQRNDADLQSYKDKQMAAAMLQVRNKKLENRQRVMDNVYSQALKRILACDDVQYKEIIKTILLSIEEEHAGQILPATVDKKLFEKAFIEEINTELKNQQRKLQFTVSSQTSSIPRGCVIDFQDFEMNYSLENILAGLWEQIKHEVSTQLFGDGNN